MPAFWTGPGGLSNDPDGGDCDGGCDSCTRDCDERGAECADPDNCRDCTAIGWCSAAVEDNDNKEEEE